MATGTGVLVRPDGTKYEGEWLEGKQHGHGTLWVTGDDGKQTKIYTGAWREGLKHVRMFSDTVFRRLMFFA
jgi:hypothetical protein